MPEVSVILPTYNRCETLKRALQSVLAQTFQDIEVIIVDDGSTDQTPEYCSSLDNPKVTCKQFEINKGGNYARNEGITHSNGELIAFIDDDDYWMPEKLEKQVEMIHKEHVDLCYTAKNIVYKGKKSKKYSLIKPRYKDLHKAIMYDNFIGSTSSIVIPKAVLENVGGFDPDLPALQDYDLYIRLIQKGHTIKCIIEPLIDYRVIDEKRSISCSLDEFRRASKYLIEKFHDDPYLYLFKRGLRIITLKRTIKSRHFLFDLLRMFFMKFTGNIETKSFEK